MNYTVGNFDICGTSLQGTINTSYDRLVKLFGQPLQLEEGQSSSMMELLRQSMTGKKTKLLLLSRNGTSVVFHKPQFLM